MPIFDPSQHPRGYHGYFETTGGRSLASSNSQPLPGATRSYGGLAIQPAETMAATISYTQPPTLTPGTVHVAPWLGVSNGKAWLQTGIAFTTGPGVLYMEATMPDGRYVFKPLGQAVPGQGYRFQVVKRPGNVYVAFLDGKRVGTVRVPGQSVGQATVETQFGSNPAGSAASYRFSFRDVSVGGYSEMPAPLGEAGAEVQAVGARGFDTFAGGVGVVKRDDRRRVVSLPRRRFPVLIRKADPTVAGVAVRAADTGRVLMLQRSITDESDPARGKWEFPGGHLEPGESAFDGARREWQEETGVLLPDGETAGSWRSGPYEGFVYVVPAEADVRLNLDSDERLVGNPDDPDGDDIEVLAWWPPSEAEASPSLRDEVRSADWRLIGSAVPGAVFKRDTRRMAYPPDPVTIRKRAYPVLVRSHVRGGQLDAGVAAEFVRYMNANPDLRTGEAAEHGFDPISDPARYLASERAEGYHDSLKGSGAIDLPTVKAWEAEESSEYAKGVSKEQPTTADVHVDVPLGAEAATAGKRKKKKPDEPELAVEVVKADDEKRIVYGIVLEPDVEDTQGDVISKEDVELAAHRFLYQGSPIGVQHHSLAPDSVRPVESYIAPVDFQLGGQVVKAGSWVLAAHVPDERLWGEVRKGEKGAWSVGGTGRRKAL